MKFNENRVEAELESKKNILFFLLDKTQNFKFKRQDLKMLY